MKRFLTDLYRDLDDRHLLLPAIALVIALVAVPFLLSSSPAPPVVPVTPATDDGHASMTESAVLTEDPGVRDYRRRLDRFKSKNPFQVKIGAPTSTGPSGGLEVPSSDLAPPAGGGSISTEPGSSVTSTGTSTGSGSISSSSTSTSTSSGSSASTDTSSASQTGGGNTRVHRVVRFYEWQAHVEVGIPGKLEERKGVSSLDVLPGKKRPIFIYGGATVDGSKALFLLSSDASEPDGDGTCIPNPSNCQYLILRKGESETVEYGPEAQRYKLNLLGLDRVLVDSENR